MHVKPVIGNLGDGRGTPGGALTSDVRGQRPRSAESDDKDTCSNSASARQEGEDKRDVTTKTNGGGRRSSNARHTNGNAQGVGAGRGKSEGDDDSEAGVVFDLARGFQPIKSFHRQLSASTPTAAARPA
ncbi:hypothetical protein KEM55_000998 [Ascosphaera atra]|nr:hypothetical protein KEM55_000998 [Ascosphaera atra]